MAQAIQNLAVVNIPTGKTACFVCQMCSLELYLSSFSQNRWRPTSNCKEHLSSKMVGGTPTYFFQRKRERAPKRSLLYGVIFQRSLFYFQSHRVYMGKVKGKYIGGGCLQSQHLGRSCLRVGLKNDGPRKWDSEAINWIRHRFAIRLRCIKCVPLTSFWRSVFECFSTWRVGVDLPSPKRQPEKATQKGIL